MTATEAKVPDDFARHAREAADKENVSVDHIVVSALAAQIGVWRIRDDIATRAARGNLADFDRSLAKVPDALPMPGDALPPGNVPPES